MCRRGLALLLVCLCVNGSARAANLEHDWLDLLSDDETTATRAARGMAESKEVVAFLKERLRPVLLDERQVAAWLKQLDSDGFAERQAATVRLEYLGKSAKPHLEKFLEGHIPLEARHRAEALLAKVTERAPAQAVVMDEDLLELRIQVQMIQMQRVRAWKQMPGREMVLDIEESPEPFKPGPDVNPHWQQAKRAIGVLEKLATPEACKILQTMADGIADAEPTIEARAALARLAKK